MVSPSLLSYANHLLAVVSYLTEMQNNLFLGSMTLCASKKNNTHILLSACRQNNDKLYSFSLLQQVIKTASEWLLRGYNGSMQGLSNSMNAI